MATNKPPRRSDANDKMKDYTIDTFNLWDQIVDYESDETSVILINAKGEKVAKFGYGGFDQGDFERYKNSSTSPTHTSLPSDEEIFKMASNRLKNLSMHDPDKRELTDLEKVASISSYEKGAKDIRSIASARIAEMERELKKAKQFISDVTEFAEGMKVLDGEALQVLKNTARRVLSDKPTQLPRK